MTRFAEGKYIQPNPDIPGHYVILDETADSEIGLSRDEMFRLINAFHQMNSATMPDAPQYVHKLEKSEVYTGNDPESGVALYAMSDALRDMGLESGTEQGT